MTITSVARWTAALTAALLLGACSSTGSAVRVDRAADVDLSQYQSFGWLAPVNNPPGTLTEQRVQAAIGDALRAKGYAEDTQHPQLEVTYTLKTYDRPKSSGMSVGLGAGGGSGHVGGGVGISLPIGKRREIAGTMSVDVFDAARKAQIWTGSLDTTFQKPDLTPEDATRVAGEILKKFPNRGQK
jgi:hypothetical protein